MKPPTIITGDVIESLAGLSDGCVHCVVTSPPYYGLRRYSEDSREIGKEGLPEEYVRNLVSVFSEVKRVLRSDGTVFLNLGDSYWNTNGYARATNGWARRGRDGAPANDRKLPPHDYLKVKDIIGIPWMVAFALQREGWYLRNDIIWCLSGGNKLYVRSQKGDMPMSVKDLARLDPKTIKLWNGEKWTQLLGMSKSRRRGDAIMLTLRSGERISCTLPHQFPTNRGLMMASDIRVGDILTRARLPEPEAPKDCSLDEDAAWLVGLYLAEGSRSGDVIQIAGHAKEAERWDRVQRIALKFGGTATMDTEGNRQSIRVYGKVINAILNELTSGNGAHRKGFAPVVWRYSNRFLASMLDGYLSGDGHWDDVNRRWRLNFCRNYHLEQDIRTACARLGYHLILNLTFVNYRGKKIPTFRGELRTYRSGHFNEHDPSEVVKIGRAKSQFVYDLGVADDPHLFALASGVLTHNSKPNAMPSSVEDRFQNSHEHIFLLTKSPKYYFDTDSVRDPWTGAAAAAVALGEKEVGKRGINKAARRGLPPHQATQFRKGHSGYFGEDGKCLLDPRGKRKRDVWTVPSRSFNGKKYGCTEHFATFPVDLITPCVISGCPVGGTVLDPFMGSGTTGVVSLNNGREFVGIELNPDYAKLAMSRILDETRDDEEE